MQRTGPTTLGGVRPPDLVALAERDGPFATVWLDHSGVGAWARDADRARRDDVLGALRAAGAPDPVVAAVGAAIDGLAPDARGAVVVASERGVELTETLPDAPRALRASWSALPALSPVLEHRQADIASIVVLADRAGADLVVREHRRGAERTVEVAGTEDVISKVAPGGWSQRRYQQRAEDSWERNADQVAAEVARISDGIGADLVVLGGDQRAVALIRNALPRHVAALARTITPGRAADRSEEHRERDVERLVDTAVAAETAGVLRAFAQQDGQHQRAANGTRATFAALQQSQVELLLVHDAPGDEREAWCTGAPGMAAAERDALVALGAEPAVSGRLVDVAVNAALRTGATVRVVPDAAVLDDGLGALLRWSAEDAGSGAGTDG